MATTRTGTGVRLALALLLSGAFVSSAWAQLSDYLIKPGDVLHISVWLESDLDREEVLVRPDGGITFPLAGDIQAAGKTVAALNTEISAKVAGYIREAVVTVAIKAISGNSVYVVGEVTKPGAYVMNPTLDVLQALALAGGTTPYASQGNIIVLRREGEGQRAISFDYKAIKKGANLDQNITLQAGDVVLVP